MSPTLQQLKDDDWDLVFRAEEDGTPCEDAEHVWFYHEGDKERKVKWLVSVDRGALEGSREVIGDGRVLERSDGRWLRDSITIEVSADMAVSKTQQRDRPDKFMVAKVGIPLEALGDPVSAPDNWEPFSVKRITGEDRQSRSVLCVRPIAQLERNRGQTG